MSEGAVEVRISEWQEAGPDSTPALRGLSFDGHPEARIAARRLREEERIEVLELRAGISVRANSHVGAIRLGPLRIVVTPKIPGGQLLRLLRYTLGLRDLGLQASVDDAMLGQLEFQDIIIHQLVEEARDLVHFGLQRRNVPKREWLAEPRGRIDFATLARSGRPGETRLPCEHYDRSADTPLNRALLAGLRLSIGLAQDPSLAVRARHLAGLMEDEVSAIRLDADTLLHARRRMDRLTAAYDPAIRLIETLLSGSGTTPEGQRSEVPLSGYLFDMNRFFERLLDRFLSENVPDADVKLQRSLTDMFYWEMGEGASRRRPPSPRPDYIVTSGGGRRAVLDAKYRDLGSLPLPREMLYQLTMYSLCPDAGGHSAILYPSVTQTDAGRLREERLHIRDPLSGKEIAMVSLRAVPIPTLADLLVERPSAAVKKARAALAEKLAFG